MRRGFPFVANGRTRGLMKILTLALSFLWFSVPAQAADPRFVDAETFFATSERGRALLPQGFGSVAAALDAEFAAVCPDSFCEGVVSNWAPLDLICTVDREEHQVGECLWSFAGSFEEVDSETGKVTVFHENRTCELGISGDAATLAGFLVAAGDARGRAFGLLTAKVPGRADDRTLFDILNACL